jgi:hypothetical protein
MDQRGSFYLSDGGFESVSASIAAAGLSDNVKNPCFAMEGIVIFRR